MLSRLTSPFSAKSRSIGGFHIDVEDPHRQYSPGDIVKGSVRLRVLKPSRVTHIVVSLHGYVQVFKNPGSPGEGFRANTAYVGTRRGKSSGEYFGNGFASLFEDEVVLCGDGRLADGSYQFNFELQFPDKDLPSSIDVSAASRLCESVTNSRIVRARHHHLHDLGNNDTAYHHITDHDLRSESLSG